MENLIDKFGRKHDYLRLSVTDKCNFRCFYCNPVSSKEFNSSRNSFLAFDELLKIIELFASEFGFKKFRFSGGEPLLRNGFADFLIDVNKLKSKYNFEICLTTNGFHLSQCLEKFKLGAVDRINISLDTLNKAKFREITKTDVFDKVIKAIRDAQNYGFDPIKINTVILKGVNDEEIPDFVKFAISQNINVRFIEYMPFADNNWNSCDFLSYKDILKIVEKDFRVMPLNNNGNSVAKDYSIEDNKGMISFISSISEHFCGHCNRLRISSNGDFRLCLFADALEPLNFKNLFNKGLNNYEISTMIRDFVLNKWEKHPNETELKKLKTNNMIRIGG